MIDHEVSFAPDSVRSAGTRQGQPHEPCSGSSINDSTIAIGTVMSRAEGWVSQRRLRFGGGTHTLLVGHVLKGDRSWVLGCSMSGCMRFRARILTTFTCLSFGDCCLLRTPQELRPCAQWGKCYLTSFFLSSPPWGLPQRTTSVITMQYLKDYDDSYLGRVNTSTWHSLFAKASKLKRTVHSADNTAAFTTATMDREMYIECPYGYEQEGMICLMKKSLEGGKRSLVPGDSKYCYRGFAPHNTVHTHTVTLYDIHTLDAPNSVRCPSASTIMPPDGCAVPAEVPAEAARELGCLRARCATRHSSEYRSGSGAGGAGGAGGPDGAEVSSTDRYKDKWLAEYRTH